MFPSSRTPEGRPSRCPICGHEARIEPTIPPGDSPCPRCGHLLWFDTAPATSDLSSEHAFLRDFVAVCTLSHGKKEQVLRHLVQAVAKAGRLPTESVEQVVLALLNREQLGSTGIGRGAAIPHAEHESITEHVWAIGLVQQGIDFEAIDDQPVTRLILLLSPPNDGAGKLRLLERTSRAIRSLA